MYVCVVLMAVVPLYTTLVTSATVPDEGPSKKKKKDAERKSKNTSVYVTGLPPDTDSDELVARFSKCGVLEEDDEGTPR